ncbi:MAG: glycosyltransferase family 2 protein [Patescibacteria group bacterium]
MSEHIAKSRFVNRLFEMIIPIMSWTIITFPLWMSPFHPALVAYFIIAFDLYFFYSCVRTVYYSTLSYRMIEEHDKIDFSKLVSTASNAKNIHHFIIIPNYKESLQKLEETITAIVSNDFPYKTISLVLAFEEREPAAHMKGIAVKQKYGHFFEDVLCTYHALEPHEVAGKASNQTHAAKQVDAYIAEKGWHPKNVIITICDADSKLPKNFFSYLTYTYINDVDNAYHFYWAPVLLYNNFWKLSFFVRIQATLSSILRLSFLSQKDKLIQISTYSTNMWLLKQINFWDVDVIPEDWHVYFQAFFVFGEKVKTLPLYTIVSGDAIYTGKIISTFVNRYEQEKRWAWGVSDIGYSLKKFFITPHINAFAKIRKILYLIENHLFWPTSFFILTISASIPPLINPVFKRTVLGFLLPQLSGVILTFSTSMILVYVYLDVKLRQKIKIYTKLVSFPLIFIQWYFLPLISFFLSSLPALESHTRMIFGKKIKYKVTEKK